MMRIEEFFWITPYMELALRQEIKVGLKYINLYELHSEAKKLPTNEQLLRSGRQGLVQYFNFIVEQMKNYRQHESLQVFCLKFLNSVMKTVLFVNIEILPTVEAALLNAMQAHPVLKVQRNCMMILCVMEDVGYVSKRVSCGKYVAMFVQAIKKHEDNRKVQLYGCYTLYYIVLISKDIDSVRMDCIRVATKALASYSLGPVVVRAAMRGLCCFVTPKQFDYEDVNSI